MKRLMIAGFAGAMLAASAQTASAIEVWQGTLFVTRANRAACAPWNVNDFFTTVLRPSDVEDNGSNTILELFHLRYAARYVFTGPLSGSGSYNLRYFGSTGGSTLSPATGNYSRARIRPEPAAGKPTLVVQVGIDDFAALPGCFVILEGSLGLRPNL